MQIYSLLEKVRKTKPLVHHITNWVTIYDCANITRTIGALPVMAHAEEEVEQMVSIAGSLVLNIGTLTPELIDTMIIAGKKANSLKKPIVLDAVGAGATDLRTKKTFKILEEVHVDIIKGNSSEIGTIAGAKAETKGVEAISVEGNIKEIAKRLALERKSVVVVTGKEDIVTDGIRIFIIKNGHDMMGSIVGTGCMASSVIASFAAVEKDYCKAAASALVCFGIAGELAAKHSKGTGTFKENFYDELYNLDEKKIESMKNYENVP